VPGIIWWTMPLHFSSSTKFIFFIYDLSIYF